MATATFFPRDRYRMPATVAASAPGSWPFNLRTRLGFYFRASIQDGDVWVRRAQSGQPPFDLARQVTSDGGNTRPTLAEDARERLWCLWGHEDAGPVYTVYASYSDNDASTWSSPVALFPNGKYPLLRQDPVTGSLVAAAHVGGVLQARLWPPGETTWRSAVTLTVGGVALAVADSVFGLELMGDAHGRLILAALKDGETAITEFRGASEFGFDFEEI